MSGLTRKTNFPFASSSLNTGEFGSAQLGTKILTNDPLVIQGTTGSGSTLAPSTAWNAGWVNAVIGGNNLPPLEEMEGVSAVASYQLSYLLARGIPEYDSGTTYNAGDITRAAAESKLYQSIGNANVGNALPSAITNSFWTYLGDLANLANTNPQAAIRGQSKNLVGSWQSNTTATWTADDIILTNSGGTPFLAASFSQTLNLATSGAGGLDTGSVAASTWYYVFSIYNGTSQNILFSLSSTSPTLPSGYTYFARIGAFKTDGSSHIIGFIQRQKNVQFAVGNNLSGAPILISGSSGSTTTPTWTGVSITGIVPTTASIIIVYLWGVFNGPEAMAAPNSNYGAYSSTTNPPPLMIANSAGSAQGNSVMGEFILESTSVFYASNGGADSGLSCLGYIDNL